MRFYGVMRQSNDGVEVLGANLLHRKQFNSRSKFLAGPKATEDVLQNALPDLPAGGVKLLLGKTDFDLEYTDHIALLSGSAQAARANTR